ncbi:MAG: hypothetical protein DRJ38_06305 [Thermoprotei archaeon]|nr:MAG: hypothetical protein DRJ38_06305 [Thermoprotei archaeon]
MSKEQVLGFVDFDEKIALEGSSLCQIAVSQNLIDRLHRGKFVKISSLEGREFLGRVIAGPFYKPEGMPATSYITKTFIVRGETFENPPPYYAVFAVEIIGEISRGQLTSTYTRPRPQSPVYSIPVLEVQEIIGSRGDMVIGHLLGYKGVKILLDSQNMNILPRNVGIFGTVGSGKTNTAQVLIEEALKGRWAVFVLDVEGEYIYMDAPNDDDYLAKVLESVYGLEPEGVGKLEVYVPIGRRSARSGAKKFSIFFEDVNPYVFAEIIGATEAQQRYLSRIVDRLKESRRSVEGEELEDLVIGSEIPPLTLREVREEIEDNIGRVERFMRSSLMALATKLERLERLHIFDTGEQMPVKKLMEPGSLTVVDLSDVEDRVKNIVIAWLLDRVFNLKIRGIKTKTMIVIEEAHTFVSLEAREKMAATLDMLKVIARRGRKRWLSLVFVSQQPGHLPAEIFELCNTRIIHALKSEININAVRRTTGGLTREHVSLIPALSTGEAFFVTPTYKFPLIIRVRPAKTMKRRF